MGILERMCVPCEGGIEPLGSDRIGELLREVPGWRVSPNLGVLSKRFRFTDFVSTMAFVNQMAVLAEEQGHHPDFCVHYDLLDIELSTHAIHGLSENDFIIAAKLEMLASPTT
jgi:4a-hydroxytetrahydrobiopterin dehydratase